MASAHILVVDDDSDLREAMTEALEDAGYSVAAAGDGAQALEYLRNSSRRPDLILLDLRMPNMDGWGFRAEQLRSVEHASIPVVVLTAEVNTKGKEQALGAAGVLRK